MAAAKKCAHCGEWMIPLYARNGFTVYICKHAPIKTVARKNNEIKDAVIYCNSDILKEDELLKDRVLLDLARMRKRISSMQRRLNAY